MNFEQEFLNEFNDKYQFLQLKDVVVKKREGVCTITFLYPSTHEDLTDAQKEEIITWIKSNLQLEKVDLKIKFLKVYLEERLILKSIMDYFENKYKLITSYLQEENIKIKITNIDVLVDIEVSPRQIKFFEENRIVVGLANYLKDNFLVNFVVNTVENEVLDEDVDIENVQMKATYRVPKRFNVEIFKEAVGTGIVPRPEYMSFIDAPKENVVCAGFIKKIERKDFIAKKGKSAGQQKAFYSFQLFDGKGKMDCLYFCSKKYEQVMETLEEAMYIVVHGSVRLNLMNKLCLYVDKIALATPIEKEQEEQNMPKIEGNVVEIEKLTALEQDTMFGRAINYNDKISGKAIVVFDIETTGLDPATDQIIELGAVKIVDGNIVEKFSTFVKPTKKIPYEVEDLTGISNKMVENAPPIEYVIKEFYDFTRGCTLSGHNIIGFDIKFVRREAENLGLEFDNPIIDTLNEARSKLLKLSKFNLGTVVKYLGLTLEGAHRAWNDAYATAQVLLKLNEVHK